MTNHSSRVTIFCSWSHGDTESILSWQITSVDDVIKFYPKRFL